MFVDKTGLNLFEDSVFETEKVQNSSTVTAPQIKKTYSFVGCNDVDDVDTSSLSFDEKEINNSLQKAGNANKNTSTIEVKTTSGKASEPTTQIDNELSDIFSQILTASQNEEFDKANTLSTKYNNLLATRPDTEIDRAQIAEIDKKITSLESELSNVSNEKYTKMQTEDEYGQYTAEQKENALNNQLKELKVKKYNLERCGKASAEELSFYSYYLDVEFRCQRIAVKRNYLTYKTAQIAQEKETAIRNKDEYKQYSLEQQENAIISLDRIFEIDETNLKSQLQNTKSRLDILNTEPIKSTDNNSADKKALLETMQRQAELKYRALQIASEKSTAMQNEDEEKQKELTQQENTINNEYKELEIKQQKLTAKLNGRELSNEEVNAISDKIDCETKFSNIKETKIYIDYKLIQIASGKSTVMLNEDEYEQYNLEMYENKLIVIYNELDGVCANIEKELENYKSTGSTNALQKALKIANKYQEIDTSQPFESYKYEETGNTKENANTGGIITIGSTNTTTVKANETITKNDGTFTFKGKKLYRNGKKYTGEFEGKMYKKGKLFTGTKDGIYYKKGEKYNGTRKEWLKKTGKRRYVYGKYTYANGVLAEGEVNGKMYHEGKLLKGLATYTPYKADGKTLDTEKAVTKYYKKGVPSAGKHKGIRYGVDGLPLNGTYKNHTYINGIKQK